VNVGRREGARASDFQRVLTERAGIDRAHVRRIRVRDRNAFVSVRREDLAKAVASLNGAVIAGRPAMAEQARERAGEGEGAAAPAAPAPSEPQVASVEPDTTPRTPAEGASETEAPLSVDDAVPTGRSPQGGGQ
jgi:ATP-dependent RNA helicase DeaD